MESLQEVFGKSASKGEDYVQYSIFLPHDSQNAQASLQDTLDMINSLIHPITKDYIWQKDRFHLSIANEHSQDPSYPFLYGITRFGDCINDEWFIVYLLQQISLKIPETVIYLSDNDGDVLLIEAALELPSWLDPSNSQNRVYLYNGNLHIIPLPSSPAEIIKLPAVLTRENAIEIIRKQPQVSLAEKKIQNAIQNRISEYPSAAKKEIHRAKCLLPKKAAFILLKEPQLITLATEAFYLRDPFSMKACASMHQFPPKEGNVLSTVRFTRTTYAQTVSQKFYAPKPFRLPSVNEKKKFQYAELGMKVACGLEMLYHQTKNGSKETYDFEGDRKFAAYLDHLHKLGYFKDEKKGSELHNTLEKQAKEQYLIYRKEKSNSKYVLIDDPDAEDEDIVKSSIENVRSKIDKLLSEYTEEGLNKLIDVNTEKEDSDDWMGVDPQQLEEILFKRMMKDNNMFGDLEKSIEKDSSMDLEAIMSNLGNFVESGKSGVDGVEIGNSETEYDDDDDESDEEGGIKFDYDEFMRILKGDDNNENKQTMLDTMEEMDQEISGHTKINASFEKAPSEDEKIENEDVPVDVELNLVKNILESFKSQQGLPGPASNILNQFGIVLPRDEE